jgi:hypothetical protein
VTSLRTGRLHEFRNPVRMFCSPGPWLATAYLAGNIVTGAVLFVIATATVVSTAALSLFTLGLPLAIGTAWILRGCAHVQRGCVRLVDDPIPYSYREVTEPGVLAHIRIGVTDPATLRDLAHVVLLFPALLLLDVVALGVWLVFLAGITLPLWYRAGTSFSPDGTVEHGVRLGDLPDGPHGGGFGVWIGDLPSALIAAVCFAVLALLATHLVVRAARLHMTVTRALLGPQTDPLAAAKRMLAEPGPLTS